MKNVIRDTLREKGFGKLFWIVVLGSTAIAFIRLAGIAAIQKVVPGYVGQSTLAYSLAFFAIGLNAMIAAIMLWFQKD